MLPTHDNNGRSRDHLCEDTKKGHWAFFGERVHRTYPYESLDDIIYNYQLGWFMSQLYMWSLDLRYQRYFMDEWLCFTLTYKSLIMELQTIKAQIQ